MLGAASAVRDNLRRLTDQIAAAAQLVGRSGTEVTLIGISKTQSAEAVAEAVRAGVTHIGENRVQEAAAKFPAIETLLGPSQARPVRHLVGHLQTNKAGAALDLFDRFDALDSLKLAQALARRLPPDRELPCLLELYVGDDPDRPGLRPAGLVDAVGPIVEVVGLRVEGVMTVAPLGANARAAFNQVATLKRTLADAYPRVHFGVLSMGMSEDFSVAIAEGATEVRVGTALFGPRPAKA
ncbi:MAG: YggS family pyridoxal phosphate-dependent enzyme [Chloroflexota bacterium]